MKDHANHEQQVCEKPKSNVWRKRGWIVLKWALRLFKAVWFLINLIEDGGE